MMNYITLDGLKTALSEMKNYILSKFYTKNEMDNKLTQFEDDVHTLVIDELDTATTVNIPKQVDTLVADKLAIYDNTLDSKIQTAVDNKELDTSKLVTKAELDITKVITSDNLAANNIATTHDLPTAIDDTTFTAMITDLTTDRGDY